MAGRPLRRARLNPYASYLSDVDLPGLKAKKGEEYHYPWRAPVGHELHRETQVIAKTKPAPGFAVVPGWSVGSGGKRAQIFRIFFGDQDTGKYALSPERAAELSYKLAAKEGGGFGRDFSKGKLKAKLNSYRRPAREKRLSAGESRALDYVYPWYGKKRPKGTDPLLRVTEIGSPNIERHMENLQEAREAILEQGRTAAQARRAMRAKTEKWWKGQREYQEE